MGFLPSSAAANNLVADGGYVYQVNVPPALPPAAASSVVAIVGAFRFGKANVPIGPINVSAQNGINSILAAVGDGIVNGAHIPFDGVREAVSATPEANSFLFIRQTDGTDTAATMVIPDLTGFASQTFTVGGAWTTAKTLTINLTGVGGALVPCTYVTGTQGDTTNAQAAALLLNQVNTSSAVIGPNAFIQKAVLVGLVITTTALISGTSQNAITSTTNVPTTMTLVAGGATFTGGAAPGVFSTITLNSTGTLGNGSTGGMTLQSGSLAAAPIFTFTFAVPYNGQQSWANIAGSASGGAYVAATAMANFVAAFNGTAAGQIPSPLGTASVGSTSSSPLLNTTYAASGGTDGTAGLTTSSFLGTDGITGRTGMPALRGQSFGALLIAGLTDPTADVSIEAFLDTVGGMGVTGFPSGTSTATAQTAKTTYGLKNRRINRVMDWIYAPDPLANQTTALVSPLGAVAGILMSLQPWQDPSNKPDGVSKGNIFGTERTVGPNNSFGLPYTNPVDPSSEGATRKLLGFNYITDGQPRTGGLLGLAHGKTSDGSNVSDVRMYDYIASRALAILQRYVGKNQLPPPASGAFDIDPVRKDIRADFNALAVEMQNPNNPQIAAFGYQFTGTAQQVAAGYCPWSIQGQTLSGIQFAIAGIAVGTNAVVAANG